MPRNVQRFVVLWLICVAVLIGAVPSFYIFYDIPMSGYAISWMLLALVVDGACWIFVWLAAWRRRNWARWTSVTVAIALQLVSWPNVRIVSVEHDPFYYLLLLIGLLIEIAAYVHIFTGDARTWFREDPVDVVFE